MTSGPHTKVELTFGEPLLVRFQPIDYETRLTRCLCSCASSGQYLFSEPRLRPTHTTCVYGCSAVLASYFCIHRSFLKGSFRVLRVAQHFFHKIVLDGIGSLIQKRKRKKEEEQKLHGNVRSCCIQVQRQMYFLCAFGQSDYNFLNLSRSTSGFLFLLHRIHQAVSKWL